jgi:hypothetical protein
MILDPVSQQPVFRQMMSACPGVQAIRTNALAINNLRIFSILRTVIHPHAIYTYK